MDAENYLANSRLFRGLEAEQLASIFQISEMAMYDRGDAIFSEGEIGESLYVVMDGDVRISIAAPGKGEEALAILKPGDSFGEMAALDPDPRQRCATAVAHQDCSLLTIGRIEFLTLLSSDHTIGFIVMHNVVRYLSEQLRQTNQKILFLSSAGMFS